MKASQGLRFGLFLLVSSAACMAQKSAIENDQVAGVWRGHSVCMVKNSPCHDEVNVYHISAIPAKPLTYFVAGNKVVDGKEQVMGTEEWKYDASTHALSYEFPNGVFRLKMEGEKLQGSLKLPDGTLYRQIYLQKEK